MTRWNGASRMGRYAGASLSGSRDRVALSEKWSRRAALSFSRFRRATRWKLTPLDGPSRRRGKAVRRPALNAPLEGSTASLESSPALDETENSRCSLGLRGGGMFLEIHMLPPRQLRLIVLSLLLVCTA